MAEVAQLLKHVGPAEAAQHMIFDGVEPCTLKEADKVVRRWFGNSYDIAAFRIMLATVAAERLNGDPLWIMFITGSGFTKTETVSPAEGAGAIVTSTIASEGALLSATPKREKSRDATGGLLRRRGERGVIVIKDFTTILSMNREARAVVIAALREIYDGKWERNVGSNGGNTLTWNGRIAIIAACTTYWDSCHSVVSSMGDRFVLCRMDSSSGREAAGRQTLKNTGHEHEMREALRVITRRVIAGMQTEAITLTKEESEQILHAADLVTRCRTAVETDYKGNVIDGHMPEAPTRFARQLQQIVRGACAIGINRKTAMELAMRCARDSMPPLRLAILRVMNGVMSTTDIREAIDKPWMTVKRQLDALHLLGVLTQEIEDPEPDPDGKGKRVYRYALAPGIKPANLHIPSPDKSARRYVGANRRAQRSPSDIPGDGHLPLEGDVDDVVLR